MFRSVILIAIALSELGCIPGPCSLAGCDNEARIDILLSPDRVVTDAKVSVCRNEQCSEAALSDQGNRFDLIGDVRGSATVWHEPGQIRLEVTATASKGLVDGDRYTITMRAADGMLLANDEWIVDYSEHYPNGKDCDHFPCLQARLETQGL